MRVIYVNIYTGEGPGRSGAIQLESGLTADFLNLRCASSDACLPDSTGRRRFRIGFSSSVAARSPRSDAPLAERAVCNLKFIALLMQRK